MHVRVNFHHLWRIKMTHTRSSTHMKSTALFHWRVRSILRVKSSSLRILPSPAAFESTAFPLIYIISFDTTHATAAKIVYILKGLLHRHSNRGKILTNLQVRNKQKLMAWYQTLKLNPVEITHPTGLDNQNSKCCMTHSSSFFIIKF